jgi:endo-1,3-1,4-beta-glycanase ExoK
MNKLISCCIGIAMCINLTATAKDYNGAELFSKQTIKYGRFDVRMRMVSGNGIISSFFLYYDDSYKGSPEPWQEIDIEVLGKTTNGFQSNVITGTSESKATSEKFHTADNLSQSYHTYTVEWTPDYIAWLFDGTEIRHTTGAQVTACQPKEMSYRFNLWISDVVSWAGQFNASILPVYQFINWIRYSKYTPGAGTNGADFTPEWQDDFDTFNSSRWAKGDWTFDGNLVDFSQNNIVVKDGYCIICLTKSGATGFSGDVPHDQGTSTIDRRPATGLGIPSAQYSNLRGSFIVTLDGRLVSRNSECFNGFNSALLIAKENNTIMRKIILSK